MATITTGTHGDYKQSSRRSYIATAAFNSVLYKYTTTRSSTTFVVSGTLSAVTGATAANCPAGRILRENGRKLYPSANPGIVTYMVGVYDANSCLSGFIDPNASIFAVYNSDKPLYLTDGVDPVTGLTTDQGAPVYTRGSVAAGTTVTAGTGGFIMPANASVAATGSTQGNSTSITYGLSVVSGANGTVGVVLPTAVAGGVCYIKGTTAGVLKIWPTLGAQINAVGADTALLLSSGAIPVILVASSATQWYTFPLVPT